MLKNYIKIALKVLQRRKFFQGRPIRGSEVKDISWFEPNGNEMDDAIVQYMKRKYNLLIGESTAEKVKIGLGSAFPLDKPLTMEVKGRNLIEGVPKTITVEDSEIREALSTAPMATS